MCSILSYCHFSVFCTYIIYYMDIENVLLFVYVTHIYIYINLPVVPHKAVAEVSKIVNL